MCRYDPRSNISWRSFQSQNQLEKLNQVILEAQFAVDTFSMISSYAKGKGLLADDKDDVGRN